jgi:hypothetical protein
MMETAILCSTKWGFQTQFELFDGPKTDVKHLQESSDHVTVKAGGHKSYTSGDKAPENSSITGTLKSYPLLLACGQKENQCPKWAFSIKSK